jgi:polyhydroxybutyrate depolymerase
LPRVYKVHVPTSYTGNGPVALLLDIHGGLNFSDMQRSISGQLAQSDKRGFIAVWPQGIDGSWNANGCCMLAYHLGVDDVGFLKAVIATLKERANINKNKVYVTGLSNGGGMSHRMACEAADVVMAAAPMSNPLQTDQCHPSRPVTVVAFAGTADLQVPYDGGPLVYPTVTIGVPLGWQGARQSLAAWKLINGCSSVLTQTQLAEGSRDETYLSCSGGVKTGLVSIADGAHDLYNGDALHQIMFVHPNYAVDVSDYVWEHVFAQ